MNARFIYKFLLLALMVVASLTVLAEPSHKTDPKANGSAVLNLQAQYPKTKRMPSTAVLEIVYEDGVVTLTSDDYEGGFSLSFENYETGTTYTVPSIQIGGSAPLALEIGEYQLTAVHEDGTVLMGYMQVY